MQNTRDCDTPHIRTLIVTQHQDRFKLIFDRVKLSRLARAQRETVAEQNHSMSSHQCISCCQTSEQNRFVQLCQTIPQLLVLSTVHKDAQNELQHRKHLRGGCMHTVVQKLLDHIVLEVVSCPAHHARGKQLHFVLTRQIRSDDHLAPLTNRAHRKLQKNRLQREKTVLRKRGRENEEASGDDA